MRQVLLKCFHPSDLVIPWHERRIRVPHSFVEFTEITHLELAHFTSSAVLPAILRFGIQPRAKSTRGIEDGLATEPNDVYLLSGVDKHYLDRAVNAHGGVGVAVIVQVPVSMLRADINLFVPGTFERAGVLNALHQSLLAGACSHRGPIAPASIFAVVDNTGEPLR